MRLIERTPPPRVGSSVGPGSRSMLPIQHGGQKPINPQLASVHENYSYVTFEGAEPQVASEARPAGDVGIRTGRAPASGVDFEVKVDTGADGAAGIAHVSEHRANRN